jgi:hypothetical protein
MKPVIIVIEDWETGAIQDGTHLMQSKNLIPHTNQIIIFGYKRM